MKDGHKLIKNFLNEKELVEINELLSHFHMSWMNSNKKRYENGAVNSAYITHKKTMKQKGRKVLFSLIGSKLIQNQLESIFQSPPCFLNTQLFFDPLDKKQRNYWHRDIQYTDLSIEEQKNSILQKSNNVIHFRIPLRDENGIELIPGTNRRWDTKQEYEVRNDLNNHNAHEDLPGTKKIKLAKGDLLIFSANMIHRGLYGNNRLSLDIIYCENDPAILKYADFDCYPNKAELSEIKNKSIFKFTQN